MTTARTFGDFIGRRYPYLPKLLVADTNPWWQNKTAVKDDYLQGGVAPEYPHIDWSDVYDELAGGIVEGETAVTSSQSKRFDTVAVNSSTWTPLITIHPTNQWFTGGPVALASASLGDRSWLTFDTSQSGHSDYAPNPPLPWWNCRRGWETVELMYAVGERAQGTKRPALDNEPHYEHRYINGKSVNAYWNASDIRVGSWQSVSLASCIVKVARAHQIQVLSGSAGVTYGADNVMQMYIPGLYDPAGSGPASAWSADINLQGASQMQHIKKAVLDRGQASYFSRVPSQDIIVGDAGTNDNRVTAARDSGGGWIMVYTPTGQPFSIDTKSLNKCDVESSWFDPVVGTYRTVDYTHCNASSTTVRQFTPPEAPQAQVDWVLVLEAK